MRATTAHSVRELFDRDGCVIFRNVLDADLIREADGHVEWLQKRHPELLPEQLGHMLMADDPFWVRLISDERLLDIAQLFVGPDIALFASHYIVKPPFAGQAVLWHQDASYWPLEPMDVVTVWLAIDAATPDNGCLRVVRGSHTSGLRGTRVANEQDNVLGSPVAEDVDEGTAVHLELRPGDVEVHHPNILHASDPNRSPNRRAGLTIRYIPTTTRILTDDPWPCAFLLRGEAVPGVNQYMGLPRYRRGRHMPFRDAKDWA